MTKYGITPWVDRFAVSRVPHYSPQHGPRRIGPRQNKPVQADVVIVGGGLAGCTTAYALAVAGVNVTLLEAGQIGRGSTASALGLIAEDPGVSFLATEKSLGKKAALHAFKAWRRAALDMSALLRRLDVKCDLLPRPVVTVATTPEQAATLKREQQARRDAGLDVPVLPARLIRNELALDAVVATREKDCAVLDPYKACLGIAAAATKRGARIFERSPVTRITFDRKNAEVLTAAGAIRAARVIVTTGSPTTLCGSLARHFWFRATYLALTEPIPATIRRELGSRVAVLCDSADPPHLVRWVDDARLIVAGADGPAAPTRARPNVPDRLPSKVIVQRTGQLMYELSTLYPALSGILPSHGWDAAYARTEDGLPYIGPHRNFPHHLFAFGDASRSVTGAYLASRILLRQVLNEVDPADAVFEFTRHGPRHRPQHGR